MPELGTIQLTIKFYTFFVQNSGPSLNLANAMSCPRGVEVSPLNQNAASLYAFISVFAMSTGNIMGLVITYRSEMAVAK